MAVILISVLAQNNMSSKCFITFLNTTAQTERSDSNLRLQPRCLRSPHASLLRRKVAKLGCRPRCEWVVEQKTALVLVRIYDCARILFHLAGSQKQWRIVSRSSSLAGVRAAFG